MKDVCLSFFVFAAACNLIIGELVEVTCGTKYSSLRLNAPEGKLFQIKCDPKCERVTSYRVYGSGPYQAASSLCLAAVHSGNFGDGVFTIRAVVGSKGTFRGASYQNGIRSKPNPSSAFYGFSVLSVPQTNLSASTPGQLGNVQMKVETTSRSLKKDTPATLPNIDIRGSSAPSTDFSDTATNASGMTSSPLNDHGFQSLETTVVTREDAGIVTSLKNFLRSSTLPSTSTYSGPVSGTSQVELNSQVLFEHWIEKVVPVSMFLVGVMLTIAGVVFWRWRKKKGKSARRKLPGKNADEEMCVCYQTLDSSSQGLLYDPETCNRPCSTNKGGESFALRMDGQSFTNQTEKLSDCCIEKCTGVCNPQLLEF